MQYHLVSTDGSMAALKRAGASSVLNVKSLLKLKTGWLDSIKVSLDFLHLFFFFFGGVQSLNVYINKPQIPPLKCRNIEKGKIQNNNIINTLQYLQHFYIF